MVLRFSFKAKPARVKHGELPVARRLLAHSKPQPQRQRLSRLLFGEAGCRAILQRYKFVELENVSAQLACRSAESFVGCSANSGRPQLPQPSGEAQHGVHRQSHLQHHQHGGRRGRPAGLLRHLLQRLLHTGPRSVQQQPHPGQQWPGGSGAGPGPLDHPVRSVRF